MIRALALSIALALGLGAIAQAQWSPSAMLSAVPGAAGGGGGGGTPIAPVGTPQSYASSSSCASGGTTIGSYTEGTDTNGLLAIAFTGDYQTSAGGTGFDDITAVIYGGTSASLAVKKVDNSGSATLSPRYVYLYYVLLGNSSTGAHNIVISCTNSHYLGVSVAEYQNVSQGAPNATNTAFVDGSSPATGSIATTPATANSWIIAAFSGYSGGGAPTAGTGTTLRSSETTNHTEALFDSNSAQPSGSAYTLNFNSPSTFQGWAAASAAFNP